MKFSKPYGRVTIVCTKLLGQPSFIQVDVIDTGYGIKQKDMPRLFKLFGFLEET